MIKRFIYALPVTIICVSSLLYGASNKWSVPASSVRRELRVGGTGSRKVTATTTVFLDQRFTGFSIFDARGVPRKYYLLNRNGSQVSIYFDAVPGEKLFLYPSRKAPLPELGGPFPTTGLKHEARGYDGRAITSVSQFDQIWEKSPPQGANFTDQVYSSFNPFGKNANALHRYEGTLRIDKPGKTVFCTASTDASFVLVNGREVAAWPGKHGVRKGLDGSKRGGLNLREGDYRFTYLHADSGHSSFAIAAIVLPGETKHFVISPDMFTSADYAFVGPLVDKTGAQQADFIWENCYMVNVGNHVMYDLKLEAPLIGDGQSETYQWFFGDGTTAAGRTVDHLVFRQGYFPVRLTVFNDGGKTTCHQNLYITPRYGQDERNDKRAIALIKKAVKQERCTGIQPEGYALISHGLFFYLRETEAAAFAPRLLAAVDMMPEKDISETLLELSLGVQQINEQYELAERCFRTILEKVQNPKAKAVAALHYGGMLNLCVNRPEDARHVLESIERKNLNSQNQRLLDIYLADTALVLDNFAAAQKMYRAIPQSKTPLRDGVLNRDIMFDYNSRFFRLRNLLSQTSYRQSLRVIDQLEWEIPEERASPQMNLLKTQALIGNNQPKKAVVCLQRALLAQIDDTYTPKLRLQLARLYINMNHLVQAKRQISLIRKESPWSREELESRKLLDTIQEKIRVAQ